MRIENHFEKINSLEGTLSKLDDSEDHETIVELCMLISAHYINAALHYMGRLRPDKDIKHNKLPGVLKREEYFDEKSTEISELFRELEEMRPSQVYGTGKNGNTAKLAKSIYLQIKEFCGEILNV
jgi:hypothetical protein